MGKTGQHRHQDWFFFLSQKNKKANERAIINGLLCWQFPLHTIKLDVGIAFFYAIFYLILCLFDSKSMGLKETAEHLFLVFSCFFKILNQGTFFSTLLSQQRHQTKCGILEQIHVCVAFVLSVVNCQGFLAKEEEEKKEVAQNNTGILYEAIRLQVRGLLDRAVSSVWLLRATRMQTHNATQHNLDARVGQAYSWGSTLTVWTL